MICSLNRRGSGALELMIKRQLMSGMLDYLWDSPFQFEHIEPNPDETSQSLYPFLVSQIGN